ncbi:MAG: hypothetical protein HYZ74_03785, partial [Elusimicrobia bacterium]|nr:hypothetical protein [Elusimicrobiota bacterium]
MPGSLVALRSASGRRLLLGAGHGRAADILRSQAKEHGLGIAYLIEGQVAVLVDGA